MPTLLLADYLRPDLVLWELPGPDRSSMFAELARRVAAGVDGLDATDLQQRLEARESEGSTAVGNGLALPHAMLPELAQTVLVVGRITGGGVDYGAADHMPIDLVILLLSPEEAQTTHIRVLARIARIVVQEALLERLRHASEPDEAYRLLVEEDARHVY